MRTLTILVGWDFPPFPIKRGGKKNLNHFSKRFNIKVKALANHFSTTMVHDNHLVIIHWKISFDKFKVKALSFTITPIELVAHPYLNKQFKTNLMAIFYL